MVGRKKTVVAKPPSASPTPLRTSKRLNSSVAVQEESAPARKIVKKEPIEPESHLNTDSPSTSHTRITRGTTSGRKTKSKRVELSEQEKPSAALPIDLPLKLDTSNSYESLFGADDRNENKEADFPIDVESVHDSAVVNSSHGKAPKRERKEKSKASVIHTVFRYDAALSTGTCCLCTPVGTVLSVSSSSTSSQWNHVRRLHPTDYLRLKEMEQSDDKDARKITKYVIKSRLPFRHVESKAFREFAGPIIRKFPSANLIANKYLPTLVAETRAKIKDRIAGKYIAFTHDGYSDANSTINLLSLTGHYIDENWDQHTVVLACREMTEAHTSQYMHKLITEIMSEYGIELYIGSTADGASNMKCLVNKHLVSLYVHCGAHNLHLCLESAFKTWSGFDAVQILKKFTATLHKSHRMMKRYAQSQIDNGKKALSIPQPIATRWNSICAMLKVVIDPLSPSTRFLAVNDCIDDIEEKISDEAQLLLKKTFKFLEKFDIETRHLSDNKTTASELIPSLLTLIQHCDNYTLETGDVAELAELVKMELVRRKENYLASDSILFTLFLDNRQTPLLKLFVTKTNILPTNLFEKAAGIVKEQARNFGEIHGSTNSVITQISPETSRYASLLNDTTTPQDLSLKDSNLNVEISSYINLIKRDIRNIAMTPQAFWKRNAVNFPELANLARGALSMPASSASSERLFSFVGLNMTEQRGNLKATRLEDIVLYAVNDTEDSVRQISSAPDEPVDISQYLSMDDDQLDNIPTE